MNRSKRLTPIKKLAQSKEKNAAQALGSSLELQKHESNKLEQLNTYRVEYLAQMETKIKEGLNGATLQHYHQFLAKLDLAISQQKNVVEQSMHQLNNSKLQWQNKRNKSEAISQVMGKMAIKERITRDKRESAQNDEMSTQAFLRRQNNQNSHS